MQRPAAERMAVMVAESCSGISAHESIAGQQQKQSLSELVVFRNIPDWIGAVWLLSGYLFPSPYTQKHGPIEDKLGNTGVILKVNTDAQLG